MKNIVLIIAAFLLTTLFASCDLSTYPIDEPANIKIDSALLGKWKEKSKTGKKDFITITRLNDYKYNIVDIDKGLKTGVMPAYLSVVNNVRFMNVYIKDSSDEGYMFYRIHSVDAKAGTLSFSTVGDSMLKYQYNPAEVRKYIAKRMNDRDFYSDTLTLVRMK